jgi:ATP-dependent Clp protease ATP-binding subunit ClpA
METSYIVVALIAGLAGGLISALCIVLAQTWMARPRGSSARYSSVRDTAPQGAPAARERFTRIEGGRGPFDRFNDRAKRVLALAQDEAVRFNHNYIGTEHLLLGLVREGEGVAARVLDSLGVELSKVRKAVEFIIGRGDATTAPSEITLSPRTKKVIAIAVDEARELGHSHVGTEHILLGIVREGEGIASGVLESLGVSLEKVRYQVIATLGQQHPRPAAAQTPQGAGPFDRIDDRSKRVLALAQDEATQLGHRHIGTEHLLLGLLRMVGMTAPDEPLKRVFGELNVTFDQVRAGVAKAVPTQPTPTAASELTLTPRTMSVIEIAIGQADARNRHMVQPEHLLLGIAAEGQGVAWQVLTALGVTAERVRAAIDRSGESAA